MNSSSPKSDAWNPTVFKGVLESYDTSMGTTRIEIDDTVAYIKALGNRQGPHMLASEFVATSLADWFGLPTAEFAIFNLAADDCFPLPRGARAQPGPAFVSRHVPGQTWDGTEELLRHLSNPGDITRLVIFDTWVRNCDRHPPDTAKRKPNYANVYLAQPDPKSPFELIAIDHTHCFDCGRDFSERLNEIDKVRDEAVYGLFPAFVQFLDPAQVVWCKAQLGSLTRPLVDGILAEVPSEWQVDSRSLKALGDQILGRAAWLADRMEAGWPLSASVPSP